MKTTTIIVRIAKPNHPGWQRVRAWFVFTEEPKTVEVTEAQFEAIKNDPILKILKSAEVELKDDPDGQEATNTQPPVILPPEEPKTVEGDQTQKTPEEIAAESANQQPEGTTTQQTEPAKPISRMNKNELVAWLIAKGLKPDTDFDPDANNKDLAELLAAS